MPTASPAIRVTVNNTTEPFESVGATHPFARWAIATMQAERSSDSDASISPQASASHPPLYHVSTSLERPAALREDVLGRGGSLFERAVEYLASSSVVHHAAPEHQPKNVFELTGKLFEPYDVDDGQINLAGCVLEDRPLLRLTCLIGLETPSRSSQLEHLFLHPDGARVADSLSRQLMLDELMPYPGKPPRLTNAELEPWVDLARDQMDLDADRRVLAVTVIWCKYAAGKIRFDYGDQAAYVSFAGWAQLFSTGLIAPPTFHCNHTNRDSYHVRRTDDGTITVEPSLAICDSSGAKVLVNQLETCGVTGRRVLPKFLATCPVSGQPMLPDQAVVCQMCSQLVNPQVTKAHRCAACRGLRSVSKEDPRLARVLGEFPRLDEWHHWRLSDLADVYLLVGNTFLKRILLVLAKEDLEPHHIASSGRLFANWSPIEPTQYDRYLR